MSEAADTTEIAIPDTEPGSPAISIRQRVLFGIAAMVLSVLAGYVGVVISKDWLSETSVIWLNAHYIFPVMLGTAYLTGFAIALFPLALATSPPRSTASGNITYVAKTSLVSSLTLLLPIFTWLFPVSVLALHGRNIRAFAACIIGMIFVVFGFFFIGVIVTPIFPS